MSSRGKVQASLLLLCPDLKVGAMSADAGLGMGGGVCSSTHLKPTVRIASKENVPSG